MSKMMSVDKTRNFFISPPSPGNSNPNNEFSGRQETAGLLRNLKDPVSSLTHLIYGLLSSPASVVLICLAAVYSTAWHIVAFSIFAVSVLLLYNASAIYHGLDVSEKITKILKRIDHMMIFVLIAGSYTPICLVTLRGVWGYSLFGVVWAMAVGGIILKALWIDAPRWLSTMIYVIMGWCVLAVFYPLLQAIPLSGVIMLALGGIAYTVGALVYALKWPRINSKYFGSHEIFHLFVMAGTTFHYVFMFKYILFA